MSRVFKTKKNQITQRYDIKKHQGIDLVGYRYALDYITAHSDGQVVSVRSNYKTTDKKGISYGNFVKIKHDNNYYTLYAHLKYGSVSVKVGDKVKKGQVIGYMGATGRCTGAHLHFEVRNEKDVKINPTPYINANLPANNKTDVIYQAYDNPTKKWYGEVVNYNNTNSNGYAGLLRGKMGGLRVKLSDNTIIRITSHIKDSLWLSEVSKWDNTSNGYSGIYGKDIDAIMIKSDKHKIKYRVYVNGKWLPWVTGYSKTDEINGYAGIMGKPISAIQISVED